MAVINVPSLNKRLTDVEAIRSYLKPYGIWYEKWPVEERVNPDASSEDILKAYDAEVAALKAKGGFVTADVINVTPATPGLPEMLAKFSKEHTHSEDEVRFTVRGAGIFHIHPEGAPVFAVQVESGDLINVPAGTRHWFNLCSDRTIRCIRLFLDASGWAPHYVDDRVDQNYASACWGPRYVAAEGAAVGNRAVQL